MKKAGLLALSLGTLLGATAAHAFTIDLENVEVDGAGFNIIPFQVDGLDEVRSVEFEFIYDAGDNGSNVSWGSELLIEVGHLASQTFTQIGTAANSCPVFGEVCEFDLDWTDDNGIFTISGAVDLVTPVLDTSGDWQILIADSFDDAGIDGRFLAGSSITLSETSVVPVPAAVWLFGSALLGMGALRRKKPS